MNEIDKIAQCYRELFGNDKIRITPLPKSGSDRKYFRISSLNKSIIGAYNPVVEENEAFIGFTKHFITKGLNVPEIYGYIPEENTYFLRDLGDVNLFTWLAGKKTATCFDDQTKSLYRKILDSLIQFQTRGIEGLNFDLCYPHKSFDRQSMMWDMNYFKYMLLKLLAVPFNEQHLENDFNSLIEYLLKAGQDYFLYRDFQTANIMVVGEEPWFIDYQGGRKGAPQYDVASLLYDAKIPMLQSDRDELQEYYTGNLCSAIGKNKKEFNDYFPCFCMIRIMQALGAFGFRGLYEKKPTFTESIVPGVELLVNVIITAEDHIKLPELFRAIRSVPGTEMFRKLVSEKKK